MTVIPLLSVVFLTHCIHSQTYNVISTEFQNSNITCTQYSCTVTCGTNSGCDGLTIHASQSRHLTLTCSNVMSCANVILASSAQDTTTIQCTAESACYSADFQIDSGYADIQCDYSIGSYSTAPCGYTHISAQNYDSNISVSCLSGYACYSMDLYCSRMGGTCGIQCGNTDYSCSFMAIYSTPNEKSISFDCQEESSNVCASTYVYCAYTLSSSVVYYESSTWKCGTNECCPFYSGKIDCTASGSVCNVDCSGLSMDCRGYFIDGSETQELNVMCSDYVPNGGCQDVIVECPYGTNCNIDCDGLNACGKLRIEGSNANVLTFNCSGSEACTEAQIYCPSNTINACNINCNMNDWRVCYNMDIFSDNAFVQNYLNLDCGPYGNQDECSYTQLNCETLYDTPKTTVGLVFDSGESEWECDYKFDTYCCPWLNTEPVVCNSGYNCYLDCSSSDCAGVIVNGTRSSYLEVQCDANECYQSNVYCPLFGDCYIYCNGQDACHNMTVHANGSSNTVQVSCSYDGACDDMYLFVTNVGEITFDTQGYQTNGVNLYAQNANNIALQCRGDYACYYMNVYANNANSISIDAGYNYGFGSGVFHAQYASSVTINCASVSYENGCYDIDWYLPSYGYGTTINCYGGGCNYFGDIYVAQSMAYLQVNVNGCGECSSESGCIGSGWGIYCAYSNITGYYSYSGSFYGSSCTGSCYCDSVSESITFIDDDTDSMCIKSWNIDPVEVSSIAAILGSVFGALFCIAFIVILVCVCGNASRKRRGRINYVSPARGLQPATAAKVVQPTPQQQQRVPVVMMAQQPRSGAQPVQYVNAQGQPVQVVMVAPQQQQPSGPNVQYVNAQGQPVRYVPVQQMQGGRPMQPTATGTTAAPPVQQSTPYNPNVIQAAPYNPSAPPSYDQVEQASAPPAYAEIDNGIGGGEADGAETNY